MCCAEAQAERERKKEAEIRISRSLSLYTHTHTHTSTHTHTLSRAERSADPPHPSPSLSRRSKTSSGSFFSAASSRTSAISLRRRLPVRAAPSLRPPLQLRTRAALACVKNSAVGVAAQRITIGETREGKERRERGKKEGKKIRKETQQGKCCCVKRFPQQQCYNNVATMLVQC